MPVGRFFVFSRVFFDFIRSGCIFFFNIRAHPLYVVSPLNKVNRYIVEVLKPYRKRLDELDDRLVDLLCEREDIIREVAGVKFANDIPAYLNDRIDEVRERAAERAESKGHDPELVRSLHRQIIEFSCQLEEALMKDKAQSATKKINKGA